MHKLYVASAAVLSVLIGSWTTAESATQLVRDRYTPTQGDVPASIAGHPVLAVLSEDHSPCTTSEEKRPVFQSLQQDVVSALENFPTVQIEQELQKSDPRHEQWGWDIVGPGTNREDLVTQYEE